MNHLSLAYDGHEPEPLVETIGWSTYEPFVLPGVEIATKHANGSKAQPVAPDAPTETPEPDADHYDDSGASPPQVVGTLPETEPKKTQTHRTKTATACVPYGPPLSFDEFINLADDDPEPLWGTKEQNVIPAGGLVLFVGKAGEGKTELTLDLAFHLADGRYFLDINVPRALTILFLENEGARGPFRTKLKHKRERYIAERLYRSEEGRWPRGDGTILFPPPKLGRIDLRREDHRDWLRSTIAKSHIDLVIGDTVNTMGVEGAGAPDEIRRFLRYVEDARDGSRGVTFFFLHHPHKLGLKDDIDDVQAGSGDWQGAPDTILSQKRLADTDARLSFTKVRYADELTTRSALIRFNKEYRSFSFLKMIERKRGQGEDEPKDDRDYAGEIEVLLRKKGPQSREVIRETLEIRNQKLGPALNQSDKFRQLTRQEAEAAGFHPNARPWAMVDNAAQEKTEADAYKPTGKWTATPPERRKRA